MRAIHSQQCRTYPRAQILFGHSTWDDDDRSVKYAYPDKNGNPARTSPEVPVHALLEMVEVAVLQGGISAKDLAAVLHKVIK